MNLIDAAVIPDSDRHSQWPFAAKSAMLSPLSVSRVCVGSLRVSRCPGPGPLGARMCPKVSVKTQKPQRSSNRPPTVSCLEFQSSRRSLIGRAVSLASYWLEPHCGGLWSMEFTVVIAESKTVFPQTFTSYNSPGVTS